MASTYGVLVGTVLAGTFDAGGNSPHYEIRIGTAAGDYRIAVNVQSTDRSEVLVHYDPAYALATKRDLPALAAGPHGFTLLTTGAGGLGLDYLRDGLFPIAEMTALPASGSGVSLKNLLDAQVARATADPGAVAIAFGDEFRDAGSDPTFGFSPEIGVHNIHMMQGDTGAYASENRVDGDGALFVRFGDGSTLALFTRFDTQSTALPPGEGVPSPSR